MTNVTPAGAGVTGPAIYIGGTTVANGTNGYLLYNNNGVLGNISIASITPPIVVGTTVVSGGTSGRVLYDNAGVLGEMTNTGSGTVNVLQTSPVLITPALGVATATSLAIGGATISTNALAVTGTTALGDTLTITPATANTSALVLTGGTVTSQVPLISATRTWNNAGVTFTSLLFNITDSASNAASLLMDLQVGSSSKFAVGKGGNLTFGGTATAIAGQAAILLAPSGQGAILDADGGGSSKRLLWLGSVLSLTNSTTTVGLTPIGTNGVGIGQGSAGNVGGFVSAAFYATSAPNTQTGATYSVAATDSYIIANRAGTVTLTLPSAASFTGRQLTVSTIQAQTVVSASSNVVPQAGGAAGTAILAATAGKWARLVSDGANWQIMESN